MRRTQFSLVASIVFIGAATVTTMAGCGSVDVAPDAGIDASTDPVMRFCGDYESTCGFGNDFGGDTYTDLQNCLDRFSGLNAARQDCAQESLSFAQAGAPETNCLGAEGGEPCDSRSTFCDQYGITCGFANSRGGQSYTDRAECLARFDSYVPTRQSCVQMHLGFAESNADLHCPHVEGAAPCD